MLKAAVCMDGNGDITMTSEDVFTMSGYPTPDEDI